MKKVFLYNKLLVLILLIGGFYSQAQDYRKSKTFEKTFALSDEAEFKIENKYGIVEILNWDKNEISIEVEVEVRAKKESKVIDVLNEIEVDFLEFKGYYEAITRIGEESKFWNQVKTKTNSVFSDGNKTRIDYKIYLPETVELDIKNKFGDLLLDDHLGDITIELSNGDLRGGSLEGKTKLTLEFAYATIDHLENAQINLDHKSEFEVISANAISMNSRSSRFRIRKAERLDIVSHRDKARIEKAGLTKIESSYTYFEIEELWADLTAECRYGSLNIDEIHEQSGDLEISVENTNVNFNMPEDRFLAVEAVYNESSGLFFPSSLRNKVSVKENEEDKLVRTTGDIGKRNGKILHLDINIIDGNLNVK
jgi:hypothetical protein